MIIWPIVTRSAEKLACSFDAIFHLPHNNVPLDNAPNPKIAN